MAWQIRFVLLLFLLNATIPTRAQSNITYVYDDLGRLVAAIDPSGDTARYSYDAVGNLLSISRSSSSSVSIIYFTPGQGPVGTHVTIYGTSFSTTPSQNTVTFNGVSATVVSSTATQIVATVPSSATTGAISVTAPAGNATSATNFTVTANSGAPTITSFTPTIGIAGTSVSVTGTNFETISANNKVKFNITKAMVTSSTATNITGPVPLAATSGRLTLTTPNGTVTSTDDFFVPPSPYVAADVLFTGRVAIGSNLSVSVGTASKIGLVVFDGTAGQRVSFHMTSVTINGVDMYVYSPSGSAIASAIGFGTGGGFIEPVQLPVTGTYSIMVDPRLTNTGGLVLNLYNVVDYSGFTSRSGPAVTMPLSTPGQNGSLLFSGSPGDKFSLQVSGVTIGGNTALTILNPDGSTLVSTVQFGSSGVFIDQQTGTYSGNYAINANPSSANTGDAAFTLYDATDITGTITPGGSSVASSITTPGQNALYTFSGTAGQAISLRLTSVTITGAHVSIRKPDGADLVAPTFFTTTGLFIDQTSLPDTGTYTIFVNPQTNKTGNATLTLYSVTDITGSISPSSSGGSATASFTTPGQNARYTFSCTSGQRLSLKISSSTVSGGTTKILNGDDSTLGSLGISTTPPTPFLDTKTVATGGTCAVTIDPSTTLTGNVTVILYDVPADFSGSTSVGGSAVTVTLTTPGQNGAVTFSGTASQQVTVRITSNGAGNITVKLLKPDGTQLTSSTSPSSSFNLAQQTLPTTGTYTITVDATGSNFGNANVSVTSP